MTSSDVPAAGRAAERVAIRPLAVRLHVRRHPAASLGRRPATRRLVAVIVVTVLAGAAAGGLRVASAVSTAAGYARTTQLAVLGQQVTALALALENERDATAAYDAADGWDRPAQAGGGAPTPIVTTKLLGAYLAQMEAAQAATRSDPDWRRRYLHLAMRRQKSIAKVAMGRKLAVRLYWMWRNGCEYSQSVEFGSYAGQLVTGHGVK